ncbi:LamG-like jellyroll fold domain-containing protein [Gimesia maris]|uniref:LamG-like jellyroll fold domain-containing protein n=1 Tax=Gimesia maris TaxID=122 RepID=UPI00241DC69C|nr:LamG-like jellyroll fold domain-containing protein [Gimesia maris]|tara:strand:+ start:160107 stop:163004 length:2898 start_codon:yes stop_codon:yes gene_type:complete
MASHIWIGGAPARAQVDLTTVPTDIEVGQTVNFTIGNKTEPVVLAGTTLADVVAELVAAWNALTISEFEEITASVGSTAGTFKLTSDTAGKPFAVSVSIGSGSNEVQVVTLGGTAATGGTFTLTFNGETTATIAYNADAATVQSALEGLSSYGSGDFAVTGSAGGPWTVTFTGSLAGTNVSLMTINVTNLTGAVNEVQTISSPNNPTGGTFTLSYAGEITGSIPYNASAATVEAALEALNTIPTGAVSCGGGSLPGTDVTVTFQGALASTDVALLVANAENLTGVTGTVTETTAGGSSLAEKAQYYWSFDGSWSEAGGGTLNPYAATVDDIVGNLSNLTPDGAINVYSHVAHNSDGVINDGIKLDYGARMEYGQVGQFSETEAFSIAFFLKPTSYGTGDKYVFTKGDPEFEPPEYYLIYNPSTGLFTFAYQKSGGFHSVTTSVSAGANAWHHVLCVYDPDNSTIKISIDGAAFESTTGLSIGSSSTQVSKRLRFAKGDAASISNVTGFMDCLGIFPSALSLSEGGDLYNNGNGQDYPFAASGSNEVQTLALTGTPTTGSVILSFQGESVEVEYNATAAEVEAYLESLSTIGPGNVNVTGGPWPGDDILVEFIGDFLILDVELIEIDTSTLVMSVTETTKGVSAPTGTVATTVTPLIQTTTTANEGPNCWDVAANWNSNTVPETGDTVYLSDSNIDIKYGLDQSAVTLAALNIEQTYTGDIGLPRLNTDGTTSYSEYRDQYLKIGATLLNIGDKQGDGSERIKINLGSVQSTVLITNTGDSPDGNTPAILLLGTHASNAININRGSLGVAYYPTEVATVATLRQAFFDNAADDTNVYLGSGVSVTDIVKSGGVLDINSATTTFKQTAGTTTIHAGAHAVLNILAGLVNYNSTGTLSAVNLSGDGVLVFDQDARPKDVTIINKFTDDSEIYDESGSITSPVIDLEKCGDLSTLHMGQDFKLTFGVTT